MGLYSVIKIRFFILFLFMFAPTWSWAQSFTAVHLSLAKSTFAPGETISFPVDLKSNVASNSYIIQHRILNSAGAVINNTAIQYGVVISNTASTRVNFSFTLPAGTPSGTYRHQIIVCSTSWAWYTVTPNTLSFNVGTTTTNTSPAFSITNKGSSKGSRGIYNRGETIVFSDTIKSNQGTAANYLVIARIQDTYGLPVYDKSFGTISLSSTSKTIGFSYTLPTTIKIGMHTVKYIVKSTDGTKTYSVSESAPKLSLFSVESYQPDLATMTNLPNTLTRLKPRVAGKNPLTGSGYLPNTADTYTQIFGDEFDGTALDTSKWWTRYVYRSGTLDVLNDECQRFNEKNTHVMGGGVLKLVARPRPGTVCHNSNYTLWDSGMLRSKTIMKFGYFEARVKLPRGHGVWPAFWLNPEDQKWPPEIDIMEYVLNGVTEFPDMLHSGVIQRTGTAPQNKRTLYADPNFSTQWTYFKAPSALKDSFLNDDFHVISGFWNDNNTYTTYLDGVPFVHYNYEWVHEDGTDAGFAHVLLNLAMGGGWPTANWTSPMTTSSQAFEIDYVRVYQKSTKIKKATSTTGRNLCPIGGGC